MMKIWTGVVGDDESYADNGRPTGLSRVDEAIVSPTAPSQIFKAAGAP